MKLIDPLALAALDEGKAIVSGAVAIDSDPAIRVFGGLRNIAIDGEEFLAVGDRALVQVMGGALGDSAQSVTLTLSGIDAETIALLDASEVSGAPVTLYRLIFHEATNALLDGSVWGRGRLDRLEVDEVIGGEAAITATVESPARGLGRRGGRLRSDADQRLIDPNDGFFRNVAFAGEKTLYWGGPRPARAGQVVNGGSSRRVFGINNTVEK